MSGFLRALSRKKEPASSSARAEHFAKEQPLRILFAGEIKSGKSSLINTLLGEKILPESISKHTAAIHYCRYGTNPSLTVYFREQDSSPVKSPLNPAALKGFLDEGGANISFIEIEHPGLPPGVDIIDTPGINDVDPYRNTLVHSFMVEADALVFVLDATRAGSISELNFLRSYLSTLNLKACVFLGNKADLLPEKEHTKTNDNLHKLLAENISPKITSDQVILVSSRAEVDSPIHAKALADWLSQCLKNKGKLLETRFLMEELRELVRTRDVLKSKIAAQDQRFGEEILNLWRGRIDRVLGTTNALMESRSEIQETFATTLRSSLDHTANTLAPILPQLAAFGMSEFQAKIQSEIGRAVEVAKASVASKLKRIPAIQQADVEMGEILGELQLSSGSSGGMAPIAIGAGLLFLLAANPLAAIAIGIFGTYFLSQTATNPQAENPEEGIKKETTPFRKKLETVEVELIKEFGGWYQAQMDEATHYAERTLRELYVSFEPSAVGTMEELRNELVRKEARMAEIHNVLQNS